MKRHHKPRFTWQVPGEDNSEGEYLRVRASGFRDRKFPMVIFSPKKRSGIAVRVGERTGTWQAKRPTTHKYRGKEKQSGGAVFTTSEIPMGCRLHITFPPDIRLLPPGTHQDGTRASLAPNSACYSFCSLFVGRRSVGGDAARFYSRASPFPAAPPLRGCFPMSPRFPPSVPVSAVKRDDRR